MGVVLNLKPHIITVKHGKSSTRNETKIRGKFQDDQKVLN